ncbi:MAG: hypothetical protein QOG28_3986 [Trebonia sp.]|nr:hypothetical protein [Trebonia sp.]
MEVDAELLAAARAAQARVVEAERAVDLARAEFRYSVRELLARPHRNTTTARLWH